MKLEESRRGNLIVSVPRTGRTWLFLASITATVGLGAAQLFTAFPDWSRAGATLLVGWIIVLIVWRILPAGTVELDVRHGVVFKDGRRIARMAQIECVQIKEPAMGEEEPYLVELRLESEPPLLLGYTKDETDASIMAARIARAIGRPVKVADS